MEFEQKFQAAAGAVFDDDGAFMEGNGVFDD
jgi:hypothetical protein